MLVLGLRERETKSAENVHNLFLEKLCDVDRRSSHTSQVTPRLILSNIVARY